MKQRENSLCFIIIRRVASSRETFAKALFESGSSEYLRANSSNEMRRHARPIPENLKVLIDIGPFSRQSNYFIMPCWKLEGVSENWHGLKFHSARSSAERLLRKICHIDFVKTSTELE